MATLAKPLKITIVGATDFLGREALRALDESELLLLEPTLFAEEDDAGETLACQGVDVSVHPLSELNQTHFEDADVTLFCGSIEQTHAYAAKALATKTLVVDASGALRQTALCITDPENPPKPEALIGKGAVLPHPIAASSALVLSQVEGQYPLLDVVLSTYHSVANAGMAAVKEVAEQSIGLLGGAASEEGFSSNVFAHQAAFNVLPQVGAFLDSGETDEEAAIRKDFAQLFGPQVPVAVSCAYVPTFVGDGVDVTLTFTKEAPSPEALRAVFSPVSGVMVLDDVAKNEYATPYGAAETSYVFVSRVRGVPGQSKRVRLWLVADHMRVMLARRLLKLVEALAHQAKH